jgi:ubiquinone biosynthesis protein UbiJ
VFLDRLQETLNRNVAESRRAQAICRQLDGRVMALVAQETPIRLYFKAADGRLVLDSRHEGETDARIEGTPLSLLALAGPDAERRLRAGGIRIEGDAETAQKFRDLLALVRPDFEEELARVLGDVAAHRIANLARGLLGWGRSTADSVATSVVEFLQEEGRDLPTRVEVDEFLEGVDRLRDDAERVEARIARLEARIGPSR